MKARHFFESIFAPPCANGFAILSRYNLYLRSQKKIRFPPTTGNTQTGSIVSEYVSVKASHRKRQGFEYVPQDDLKSRSRALVLDGDSPRVCRKAFQSAVVFDRTRRSFEARQSLDALRMCSGSVTASSNAESLHLEFLNSTQADFSRLWSFLRQ